MININKENISAIILVILLYILGFCPIYLDVSQPDFIGNTTANFVIYTLIFIGIYVITSIFVFILTWILWHICYLWYETRKNKFPIQITSQNLCQREILPDSYCRKVREKLLNKLLSAAHFLLDGFTYYPLYCIIYFGKTSKDFIENHSEWRAECLHNGIVICPSRGSVESYYSYGPEDLTEYFLINHIPYKVYACDTVDDFKSLVKNDKIGVLWLFGHGTIGSFTVTNNEIVDYYEFETDEYQNHKKIAIYQLHCNSEDQVSPNPLSKILVDGWDFREKGANRYLTIKAYIRYVISHHTLFPGIWESVD